MLPLSPTVLAFGNVQVNSASAPWHSAPQDVTVTNKTAAAIAFTAPTFCTTATGGCTSNATTANYSQLNTCGASVAANSSCTISVTLTPSATGARNAFMNVAGFGTTRVALTGTGVNPTATALPSPLAFGNVQVGSTSAPLTVTLTNTGIGSLAYTSATFTTGAANYAQTLTSNPCVSPLAVGANCTIGVTFAPGATTGAHNGTLSIVDGAGTQTVSLTGAGGVPNPSLGAGTLNFGNVSTSNTLTLTLTNTGATAAPFVIGAISVAKTNAGNGTYALATPSLVNPCVVGNTLAGGATCTIRVTFASLPGNSTTTGTVTVTGTGVGVVTAYTAIRSMTGA